MKKIFTLLLLIYCLGGNAQVFNYGYQEVAYKEMISKGVCFIKTGNERFDSTMLACLEEYWTISDFTFVERYKKPPKETTALFVTTKTRTKKYMMDRKNQHVLVLQPAKFYDKDKQVPMDQTLGYMYYNGFYELVEEDEEYRFNRYIIQTLNKGLSIIKEQELTGTNDDINGKVMEAINLESSGWLGNTLLLTREHSTHFIDIELVKKYGMQHRLFAKEGFYEALQTEDKTHYILYYSVNTKTELSLINVVTGRVIYTRQFPEGYVQLKAKDIKLIAPFFK